MNHLIFSSMRISAWVSVLALAGTSLHCSAVLADEKLWLGAGLSSEAAYLGSPTVKASLIPLWDFKKTVDGAPGSSYFARVSRGYPEAGLQTQLMPGIHAGIQFGFEPGRKLKDYSNQMLAMGVNPIGDGIGMGVHLEASGKWGPAPMAGVIRYRQRTPAAHGMLLDLRYDVGIYGRGAFGLGLNAQAIWANADAMQTDFGVTAEQGMRIGAGAFNAQSGWQSTALGLSAQYDITPTWQWVASIKRKQLGSTVAASPIVQGRSSTGIATGLLWKF